MVRPFLFLALFGLVACFLTGCATTSGTSSAYAGETQTGMASWYGSENGRTTASGETFNPRALTAAHRHFPFGTLVRVTNRANGRSVDVRINDRGPWTGGRVIDLSSAAADELQMKKSGVVSVEIEVLEVGSGRRSG